MNEMNRMDTNEIYTSESIVLDALRAKYPKLVEMLLKRWPEDSCRDEYKNLKVSDYIIMNLPGLLSRRSNNFEAFDKEKRMNNVAEMFKKRGNPALFKKHYPTGFPVLDSMLDGGFTPGIHSIGAVSSLGKSTLVLQMADSMAAQGIPVIYVSLEMDQISLTAKLISAYTLKKSFDFPEKARTCGDLTSESVMTNLTEEEWDLVQEATDEVVEHGKNITIIEKREKTVSVDDIALHVHSYIETYKVKPVVMIDYLHILDIPEHLQGASDKQQIDYKVGQLRALTLIYDIPIILISSFNRASYTEKVSLQSFKESGSIEYSSDTVIGIQLYGVGKKDFDVDEAKKNFPREVQLVLLKNRYGASGETIDYYYYAAYNHFMETIDNPFQERDRLEAAEAKKKKEEERKRKNALAKRGSYSEDIPEDKMPGKQLTLTEVDLLSGETGKRKKVAKTV